MVKCVLCPKPATVIIAPPENDRGHENDGDCAGCDEHRPMLEVGGWTARAVSEGVRL